MPRGFFPKACFWLVSLAMLARPGVAWDQHTLVTRASLSTLPGLAEETVPYIPFEKFLGDVGYASPHEFNEAIQIRKEYEFLPHLGEKEGEAVSLLDILAEYSDEPDWGMDKEVFGQYPEVWREEYSRMGGKVGTPSQAFRHMYWQGFSWRMPLRTLKSPILSSPMGLAPERATLFINLSRQARAAGHPYWATRFVANALHYLEDVAQPFHASQTPTKRFLWMPLFDRDRGSGFENYVLQVQNIIAYYHYSFENYIGHEMRQYYEGSGEAAGAGKEFFAALAGESGGGSAAESGETGIAGLVIGMAGVSVRESARSARSGVKFFPPIEGRFATFDPEQAASSDRWWSEVRQRARSDSDAKQEYFGVVREMFSRLGIAVRSVVRAEVMEAATDEVSPGNPPSETRP